MKIAIAGAGLPAGTWQNFSGRRGLSPDIFDGMNHETRCGCRSCGWGAPLGIEKYLSRLGLSLDDYLLEPMPSMNFDGLVARTPLCTLDKTRLIHDLTGSAGLKRRNLGRRRQRTMILWLMRPGSPGRSCRPPDPT